jgi:hypothetical protein
MRLFAAVTLAALLQGVAAQGGGVSPGIAVSGPPAACVAARNSIGRFSFPKTHAAIPQHV